MLNNYILTEGLNKMELNESQIETINRMLGESAPVVVKKVVAKKVQKDEGSEEDEVVEMKKVKMAIKVVKKVQDVLEKKGEEKLVAALVKVLEYLGEEAAEKEEDEE